MKRAKARIVKIELNEDFANGYEKGIKDGFNEGYQAGISKVRKICLNLLRNDCDEMLAHLRSDIETATLRLEKRMKFTEEETKAMFDDMMERYEESYRDD